MPATTPVTSKQEVQIADLATSIVRVASSRVIEKLGIDSDTAQMKIIENGERFQKLLEPQMTRVIMDVLNKMSGRKHPQAELIEQYFAEVLNYTLDLNGVVFPEKEGFATYMVVPSDLDEDQIFSRITTYFKVGQYAYQSPAASNINREVEQKRPQGLYVFAHCGGDEPDAKHLGKSYDDAMGQSMQFLNPKEYLLATGFHRFMNKDHFMDVKGYTRTSSLWSGGGLVGGGFVPGDGELGLRYGNRGNRRSGYGPRELFLG